jgi:ABC-type phosphate/phosphonate transport system substrate-binding protein
MIASLPMYDLPEVRDATIALWDGLARRLGVNPRLLREEDYKAAWRKPDLLFSQTCGYPFTHEFKGQLTYVATPHYKADGCNGPLYRSILFAREANPLADFRNSVAAVNSPDSMSGMLALRVAFEALDRDGKFFSWHMFTGSHVASLAAVQAGSADISAIDCVTVALLRKHRPTSLAGLVEVARSPTVPGLPYVTRSGDPTKIHTALMSVLADAELEAAREALLLSGASVLPSEAYDVIPAMERRLRAAP